MNAEEKKAWDKVADSRSDPRIVQVSDGDRAILSAAAVIDRAGDVEKLRVAIKHDTWAITSPQDPFIMYQEGRMSKGKLCEYIANAVTRYLKEEQ